jgi:hypothetical protein
MPATLRRLQWKRAIHSASQCYASDLAPRARIQQHILPTKAKPAWRQLRPMFAAAAAVLLATGRSQNHPANEHSAARASGSGRNPTKQDRGELADLHATTLASANPVDVVFLRSA